MSVIHTQNVVVFGPDEDGCEAGNHWFYATDKDYWCCERCLTLKPRRPGVHAA